jgi:pimeloyl-ACP methyl ester carboxylesterase
MTRTFPAFLAVLFAVGLSNAFATERPKGPLTEEGEIAGAAYRIDIPANWNGGLVMFAHGYAIEGSTPAYNMQIVNVAGELGYAVAQSRYSRQGWAAREGILDTEALRRFFVDRFGDTYPTLIAGQSQGAVITYATIERFPEVYDGALPMCGAGSSALEFFRSRVFDMRVLFDYYFPGLPGSAVEFPESMGTMQDTGRRIGELIAADREKAERYARMVNLSSVEAIPGVLAFWTEILRELQTRTGGNAFGNRETVYSGSDDDKALNREIPRYDADPKAVEYLEQWVTLSGEIADPVLALHTLVDDLIPPPIANEYYDKAVLAGTAHLYAQQYSENSGHCAFSADDVRTALRDLIAWIEDGTRPERRNVSAR